MINVIVTAFFGSIFTIADIVFPRLFIHVLNDTIPVHDFVYCIGINRRGYSVVAGRFS